MGSALPQLRQHTTRGLRLLALLLGAAALAAGFFCPPAARGVGGARGGVVMASAGGVGGGVRMQKIGKSGPGNLGSKGSAMEPMGGSSAKVQTIVKEVIKEDQDEETERKEQLSDEDWWRVILHNDEIHTFDYVTQTITRVVKMVTMKKAYEITMETHKAGKATVTTAWKSQSETYCLQLQQCGLTASIAPDSNFEGDGEGGATNTKSRGA